VKIIQIIRGLDIGGDSGGAELVGIKIARELIKFPETKVEICVFYSVGTESEKRWCDELNQEGITTYFVSHWKGTNNLSAFLKGVWALANRLKDEPADVLHAHFQLGTLAALILKASCLTKKAFRTAHIQQEWNHGKWTSLLKPIFIDWAFPRCLDGEIAVSKALEQYLLERKPGKINPDKVHLFYNAIDIPLIKKYAESSLESEIVFKDGQFSIVSVGRLAEQKGFPFLIEAIAFVKDQIPNIKIYILGEGEDKSELLAQRDRSGLTNQIEFLGLVPQDKVPAILIRCDLFVLASLWEGLPTVVLEAMALKVPVIATEIPGTTELVQNGITGWLVPPKDPKSLAHAIINAYLNPQERATLANNAFSILTKYCIDQVAKQYYELYLSD
jgi:glycosyltransferase involved in cell wall biosynthesis